MLKLSEVIKATGGKTSFKGPDIEFSGISTDSRSIKRGDLFIAISGKKFDGNAFALEALKKGAKGIVSPKNIAGIPNGKVLIKVPDTMISLHDLALFYRKKMSAKIIGVTGSSGKTTTKDMIASILKQAGPTVKTEENFNNEIGVPLTIFKIRKRHKYAVIEMGMQEKGEISLLSKITEPDAAVITNIGKAHLKNFRDEKDIALSKSEIFDHMNKNGAVVLNADDKYFPLINKKAELKRKYSFGLSKKASVFPTDLAESGDSSAFAVKFKGSLLKIKVPVPGAHNVYNALAAIALSKALGIGGNKISKGISNFRPSSRRTIISYLRNGAKIINDSYNANPSSMKAALVMLSKQGKRAKNRRIAVIADMLELGKDSVREHKNIGRLASSLGIDIVVATGRLGRFYENKRSSKTKFYYAKNNDLLADKLKKIMRNGDIILLKASRGMKLDEVCQKIIVFRRT